MILVAAAGGNGRYLFSRLGWGFSCRSEELLFSVAVGLGELVIVVLVLGLIHLLYSWVIILVVIVWGVLGIRMIFPLFSALKENLRSFQPNFTSLHFWVGSLAVVAMVLNLVRALVPVFGATDPLAYQLALPKIFLKKHYLSFEPTITGALYPTNIGLLYLVCMALRNAILAQVLHWTLGLLSCLATWSFCRRYFDWKVGVWAGTLFSFIPVLVIFGSLGYVDAGLCFFQLMAFWAVVNWSDDSQPGGLVLAGILTGLAMGVKHQGIATFFVGGIVVWAVGARRGGMVHGIKTVGIFAAVSLGLMLPWYARSYVLAGNPIWPMANGLFAGEPFGPIVGGRSTEGLNVIAKSIKDAMLPSLEWFRTYLHSMSPWEWTFAPPGWQKDIGVFYLAFLPGALFLLKERKVRLLAGFCLIYFVLLIRFLHMNPRYGLVLFAFLSVLCGLVAQRMTSRSFKPVSLLFRCGIVVAFMLNISWSYAMARTFFPVVLGTTSREAFLKNNESNYRLFQYINQNTPESARILLQGIVKGFYCEREYLWDHPYQRVISYNGIERSDELLQRFKKLEITHVARMINIPPARLNLGYPQYFTDPLHEDFRNKYLKLVYRDESYVLFEVLYPQGS